MYDYYLQLFKQYNGTSFKSVHEEKYRLLFDIFGIDKQTIQSQFESSDYKYVSPMAIIRQV